MEHHHFEILPCHHETNPPSPHLQPLPKLGSKHEELFRFLNALRQRDTYRFHTHFIDKNKS